ncbi:glycosyltransferase family 25 protein [Vibrio caribbeanicus]|uniref:glycosyltransferase family 25 protein n=1 Tax=Vibrio caribbeanicus TaxID=701175 RepID=UPI0022842F15|nr:glycosyltransferase family 25 protein [Vibrio caribbeanicus]MCY9844271.1 glycosyltransferase family 25 protein [Vibrio caribbeanicus]
MKIFVISLLGSTERRQRVSAELEGFSFSFFDAVNGHEGLPVELEKKIDDNHRRLFRSRPLTSGERGCYASHYLLWQECVALDEPIIVLEDDFKSTRYFATIVSQAEAMAQDYDYIRLEPQYSECLNLGFNEYVQKVLWLDNSKGTTGYIVTPKAARAFLKASERWVCSVDNFISETYLHGIPSVGVMPYAIYAPNDMGSTIQDQSSLVKVPLIFKVTRELHRFYRFLRMSLSNYRMSKRLKL